MAQAFELQAAGVAATIKTSSHFMNKSVVMIYWIYWVWRFGDQIFHRWVHFGSQVPVESMCEDSIGASQKVRHLRQSSCVGDAWALWVVLCTVQTTRSAVWAGRMLHAQQKLWYVACASAIPGWLWAKGALAWKSNRWRLSFAIFLTACQLLNACNLRATTTQKTIPLLEADY